MRETEVELKKHFLLLEIEGTKEWGGKLQEGQERLERTRKTLKLCMGVGLYFEGNKKLLIALR